MANWLTKRFAFWKASFQHWLRAVMGILVSAFTILLILRDAVLDPKYRDWFLLKYIPDWPWYSWAIIGLALLFILALEGAYGVHKSEISNFQKRYRLRVTELKNSHRDELAGARLETLVNATLNTKQPEGATGQPSTEEKLLVTLQQAETQTDEAPDRPITAEANLVFKKPRTVKILRNERGRYYKNEKGLPAAIVEIKNDADVPHPTSEVSVRANVSFEATNGEHDFSIPDAAWLEHVVNEVRFRLGDTKALIVAAGYYQVFAIEVKTVQRGIRTLYHYVDHELTADEYKVEVQLFANHPRKMVGKRGYRLIVRPELKIEEIKGLSNAKILEDLSELKNEGSLILTALESHHVTVPYKEQAERWAERVERYLKDNNMRIYELRFNNTLRDYTYPGTTTANTRSLFHWLYTRIMRLEEFIKELSKD